MRLFRMELGKICEARLVWLGLLGIVLLFAFWNGAMILEKRVYEDGREYKGLAAIQKNQEIVKPFEGAFSKETAEEIIERYGFWSYDRMDYKEGKLANRNFCNFFVTRYMTEYGYKGEGPLPTELAEESSRYSGNFLRDEGPRFGYIEGWEDLRENMILLIPALCILVMIAVAPVFSGEYGLRTAAVTLSCVHGKKKDIVAKIAAALAFSALIYSVCVLLLYGSYLLVYGTDGLNADARLIRMGEDAKAVSIGGFFVRYFFAGFFAMVSNTGVTLALSALCRKNFITIIASALFYLFPVMGNVLNVLPPSRALFIVQNIFTWFPFYSAHMIQGLAFLQGWKLLFRMLLPAAALVTAYRTFRNWEDGRR